MRGRREERGREGERRMGWEDGEKDGVGREEGERGRSGEGGRMGWREGWRERGEQAGSGEGGWQEREGSKGVGEKERGGESWKPNQLCTQS